MADKTNKRAAYVDVELYEEKLKKVMSRLKVSEYDFNWDKDSAYIEFTYKGQYYKFDHDVERANARRYGKKIKYGTDAFAQLVLALEDLARMVERGIYDLSVWISGMLYLPEYKELPKCFHQMGFTGHEYPSKQDVDVKYKELLKVVHPDNGGNTESFVELKRVYEECLKIL